VVKPTHDAADRPDHNMPLQRLEGMFSGKKPLEAYADMPGHNLPLQGPGPCKPLNQLMSNAKWLEQDPPFRCIQAVFMKGQVVWQLLSKERI
jgi:hypothetical protein